MCTFVGINRKTAIIKNWFKPKRKIFWRMFWLQLKQTWNMKRAEMYFIFHLQRLERVLPLVAKPWVKINLLCQKYFINCRLVPKSFQVTPPDSSLSIRCQKGMKLRKELSFWQQAVQNLMVMKCWKMMGLQNKLKD